MHAERAHYGTPEELFYIVRAYFTSRQFGVNWHIYMDVETFPGILSLECQDIEGIADMSSRVLWHFMTRSYKYKEHPLMGIILL